MFLGVRVALVANGRVLLVRSTPSLIWDLPGECLRSPEMPEIAAARAVRERTRYELLDTPELLGLFVAPSDSVAVHYVAAFASGDFQRASSSDDRFSEEMFWANLQDFPSNSSSISRQVASLLID